MILEPRIRNNICVNAHPLGCAAQVRAQIQYVRSRDKIDGPKKVLVIGASNGYGLAARIVSAFGSGAATIGIGYEKSGRAHRTGTAGWYNIEAFRKEAGNEGLGAWNVNADAFAEETKTEVVRLIQEKLGRIDFLVYSIAAPRRMDPETGEIYSSVIKPIGERFTAKTVDFLTGKVEVVTAEPASAEEVQQTVKVMGGEDWLLWSKKLRAADLLAPGFLTVAFSYIGSVHTRALYRDGTIGAAKKDLEQKVVAINQLLAPLGGKALISVNKALVTRASAVIPAVPLYIALLYRVMKAGHLHEGCIAQMYRLYHDHLFSDRPPHVDQKGRIRIDDYEMRPDVQQKVSELWAKVDAGNIRELADIDGLRQEFLRHHGFDMPGIDYTREIDPADF
jgi:enoyl-[acyl-carrier protein] reductase/trans-2-enoyl-CoA reductase (NAD+)